MFRSRGSALIGAVDHAWITAYFEECYDALFSTAKSKGEGSFCRYLIMGRDILYSIAT
jgi:hypothetical protein